MYLEGLKPYPIFDVSEERCKRKWKEIRISANKIYLFSKFV